MQIIGILIGLLVLIVLVVIHELAHAWVAAKNGVVVEEFGIGLPPQAWKKKLKNGILFTLNWLPVGGFVKMKGEYDAASKKGDYGAASFWQKTKILLAGVVANWLFAAVIFTILALIGLPKVLPNQFEFSGDSVIITKPVVLTSLTKDYPAEKAGLKVGDSIVKFAGSDVATTEKLMSLISENRNKQVIVVYNRDGVELTTNVTLGEALPGGTLGAGLGQSVLTKSTWSAPIVGVAVTAQLTAETINSMGGLISNLSTGLVQQLSPDKAVRDQASLDLKKAGDNVAGPIGILGTIFPAASSAGLPSILFLTAIISLTLAVMNVLPIPALDGGRWLTMALFKISKKSLTYEREEKIQAIGFYILMGLIILVTVTDVAKIF